MRTTSATIRSRVFLQANTPHVDADGEDARWLTQRVIKLGLVQNLERTPPHMTSDTPSPHPESSLPSRRTVVRSAAWSLPVVAVMTATPAAMASTDSLLAFTLLPSGGSACDSISDATVRLTTGQGSGVANTQILITLAPGLTFPDGSSERLVTTDATGTAIITGITTGSTGGSFGITASVGDLTATGVIPITASTTGGQLWQFAEGAATPVPGTDLVIEVQANNDSANYARRSDGQVYRWGGQSGSISPTLIPNLSGASAISTWAVRNGATGGLAIVNGTVLEFANDGAATPVAGLSDVVQVVANHGVNYALTGSGQVYVWRNANRAQMPAVPTLVNIPGTVDQISAWGVRKSAGFFSSGMALVAGQVYSFTDVQTPALVPNLPPIREVQAYDQAYTALSESGEVYAWGDAIPGMGIEDGTPELVPGLVGAEMISTWAWHDGSGEAGHRTGGIAAAAATCTVNP